MINLFDPKYKIVTDNATDNSAGIQAWADDVCASGAGYIPAPPKMIAFRSPIVFQPKTGAFCRIRVIADGFTQFNYLGTGNAFIYKGLRNSLISGIGIIFGYAPLVADCVAHDMQFDAAHNDCGNNTFENLFVQFNGCKNCVGFRIGQDTGLRSSSPCTTLRQCCFTDVNPANGNTGIQVGGGEAYCILVEQCAGAQLAQYLLNGSIKTAITAAAKPGDTLLPVLDTTLFPTSGMVSVSGKTMTYTGKTATTLTGVDVPQAFQAGMSVALYVAGQGVYSGSGTVTVLGGGGSNNACDFWQQANGGTLRLVGTRWESGRRLYQDSAVCASGFVSHLEIDGGYLAGYDPTVAPIWVRGSGSVAARGWTVYSNKAPWGAGNPLISFADNYTGNRPSLSMDNCDVYGTDPLHGGSIPVSLRNVQLTNAAGHVTGSVNALRNGAC